MDYPYCICYANGKIIYATRNKPFTWEEMRAIVGGSVEYPETPRTPFPNGTYPNMKKYVVVNEEGKNLKLPKNEKFPNYEGTVLIMCAKLMKK